MQLAVVLAFRIVRLFILIGGIHPVRPRTDAAIWKMRKDDFWDEPPG